MPTFRAWGLTSLTLALLGGFYSAFGAWMLIDPEGWLSFMISRTVRGPLPGEHFITDAALAFMASGFGFLLAALLSKHRGIALAACIFPALHAGLHIVSMMQGEHDRWLFDYAVIVAPAAIGVLVALLLLRQGKLAGRPGLPSS